MGIEGSRDVASKASWKAATSALFELAEGEPPSLPDAKLERLLEGFPPMLLRNRDPKQAFELRELRIPVRD